MARRFKVVESFKNMGINLPTRKTKYSAGYDFEAGETAHIGPNEIVLISTGIKAYMEYDEVLVLHIRSSLAVKKRLILANGTGIIDADYVDNKNNEGHIQLAVWNTGEEIISIKKGEAIAQGIFLKYLLTCDDAAEKNRIGGFGSTDY